MSANQKQEERASRVAALFVATASEAEPGERERGWDRFCARRRQGATAGAAAAAHRPWGARPRWFAAAACAALVGTLGFSSTARTATARVLSLFRISQVAALPLDLSAAPPLGGTETTSLLRKMIADDVTVTLDEKNQAAAGLAQASALAGFAVRTPVAWAAPQFRLQGGKDFHMAVDRDRAQAILDEAGVLGVELPASLNGMTVAVHLPRAVAVMYGACDAWAAQDSGHGTADIPTGSGCTVLGEGPSPTVALPPGLDMQKIAAIGLQLLGMSASEAQQYCQTIDWTSTLVVPFPRDQAQSRTVAVDGVSGILLTRDRAPEGAHYVLLWSRQGMLYSVTGAGDGSQGLSLAAQLPR